MTAEPTDGVNIGADLWAAWVINANSLAVQAWVINVAADPDAEQGCACPACAPHEQAS